MLLKPCRNCANMIHQRHTVCPYCGVKNPLHSETPPQPKDSFATAVLIGGLLTCGLVILAGLGSCLIGGI